ncbi:hypothetical protein EDB92DRAFT_1942289 [Lactarius akahatsu]|uniref:Uncharacterized protein n=1 Tax=Lactarius akahatsu TaxID=416441 RepID=A0AAD4LRK9_9AGAM|nr:hypothetical protein EDB92DRAFT_1942289 [Lactarius akahatsu]
MALATAKVALITGAARGIGRAIALRLADDGLDVAVNDRSSSPELDELVREIKSKGRRSLAVPADVSLEPEVEKSVRKVVQDLGSLDVMVANAGIVSFESFLDTTVENFDRLMAVNARGTMLCYKHAAKQMIVQARGGRIIGAFPPALELGKYGITVNAYAPGIVETPMIAKTRARFGPDALSALVASTVVNRLGTPEEIAGLVSYLASSGSGFVTGQSISINGGSFFD